VLGHHAEEGLDGRLVDRAVEVARNLRIAVDGRHRRLVLGPPTPQAQAQSEELVP